MQTIRKAISHGTALKEKKLNFEANYSKTKCFYIL